MFELAPDRTQKTDNKSSIHCCYGMPYAAFVYAIVSIVAYSIWAFHLVPGRGPMFVSIALVYFGLSGLSLSRLVLRPGVRLKYCTEYWSHQSSKIVEQDATSLLR